MRGRWLDFVLMCRPKGRPTCQPSRCKPGPCSKIRGKLRIARLAKETGRSARSLMIEALGREVSREELMREFVREAQAADMGVEAGAAVYRAKDMHAWLECLSCNPEAVSPKAWHR